VASGAHVGYQCLGGHGCGCFGSKLVMEEGKADRLELSARQVNREVRSKREEDRQSTTYI
jgi:hypothetical protein